MLEATFQGNMPEIFVFPRNDNDIVKMPPEIFSIGKPLSLEGNFNKFFYLFVEKGKEQEALELLTPDIMANLIDKASKIIFEFFGNKMYIYITKPIYTKSEMQSMFSMADYLITLFKHNASEITV